MNAERASEAMELGCQMTVKSDELTTVPNDITDAHTSEHMTTEQIIAEGRKQRAEWEQCLEEARVNLADFQSRPRLEDWTPEELATYDRLAKELPEWVAACERELAEIDAELAEHAEGE